MAFQPNTTVYLCAGTGMDASNSIWWHKYAYPHTDTGSSDDSWWNTCFQFFKAHSIAEGSWYCTYLDPSRGFFKVGRMPLNDNSIPMGESGLGNSAKQAQINNPNIPFAECIRAVDYIIFANDAEGFSADIQYAFVTEIKSINHNVAAVYFTIDAIMTYQKFFHLGRCLVERDMQFQERDGSENGKPVFDNLNRISDDFAPGSTDYVQELISCPPDQYKFVQLGAYGKLFCMSDVDLSTEKITPNPYFGGIASFVPSQSTKIGDVDLGVGVYLINNRQCEALTKLGSFDAMEHLLYVYTVPLNLVPQNSETEPVFIANVNQFTTDYTNNTYDIPTTKCFSNIGQVTVGQPTTDGYTPLNIKTYTAPYSYYSVTDMQGSSMEILPQLMTQADDSDEYYFTPSLYFNLTVAPNVASTVTVDNYLGPEGYTSPLLTLWQQPSYAMTPNASGYANNMIQAITTKQLGEKQFNTGSGMNMATSLLSGVGNVLGAGIGAALGGGIGAGIGGSIANSLSDAFLGPMQALGRGSMSAGVNNEMQSQYQQAQAKAGQTYGLPKAVGGVPSGMTTFLMNNPGYRIFRMHLQNDILMQVDLYFSIFGYLQNAWRYPHINIRRRWCYVKLATVNIVPEQANQYDAGGVPLVFRQQIESRLRNGVTFWNMRHALMGDNDSGASTVQSWEDSAIQENKNCHWIKNYGKTPDDAIMKDNLSWTGGYATDYTDDYDDILKE